jgi:hypothetical protein
LSGTSTDLPKTLRSISKRVLASVHDIDTQARTGSGTAVTHGVASCRSALKAPTRLRCAPRRRILEGLRRARARRLLDAVHDEREAGQPRRRRVNCEVCRPIPGATTGGR